MTAKSIFTIFTIHTISKLVHFSDTAHFVEDSKIMSCLNQTSLNTA